MFQRLVGPFGFTRNTFTEIVASTGLAGLIALACSGGCFFAKPSLPPVGVEASMPIREPVDAFFYDGHTIRVDRYEPDASGKYPAVLVLPAVDGVAKHAEEYRESARLCVRKGYVVLMLHYFDRYGIEQETDPVQIKRLFFGLMATVSNALQYATHLENADAEHIALVGHSLGAYLSLSVAPTEKDPKIAAVVDFYGALPALFNKGAERMPPTLILHGDADPTVPVQEAHDLKKRLQKNGRIYDIELYADQGHGFQGVAKDDATRRTMAFLDKHLKTSSEVAGR
jgi:carboxymethylenebutenolidase